MHSPPDDVDMDAVQAIQRSQSRRNMRSEQDMDEISLQNGHLRTPSGHDDHKRSHGRMLSQSPHPQSDDEWPDDNPTPLPPERKRNASSFGIDPPNKRQRNYVDAEDHPDPHSPQRLSEDEHRSDFEDHQPIFQDDRVEQRSPEQDVIGLGTSNLDPDEYPWRQDMEAPRSKYASNHDRFLRDDATPRIVNEDNRYTRAQTQTPGRRFATPSRSMRISQHQPLEEAQPRQFQEFLRRSAQRSHPPPRDYQVEPGFRSEPRVYSRFASMGPEAFAGHMNRRELPRQPSRHRSARTPAPRLGSPIWPDEAENHRDSRPVIRVAGDYVVTKAGNDAALLHPHGEQPGYYEGLPRTPDRSRGRNVAPPRTPTNQRKRSSSRPMMSDRRSRSRGHPQPDSAHCRERSRSIYHTPLSVKKTEASPFATSPLARHYEPEESMSEEDSPFVNDVWRKGARGGSTARANHYDVKQVIPNLNIFKRESRTARFSTPHTPGPTRTKPEPEVIDLLSADVNTQARSRHAPIKSTPMRDRIAPATRPSGINGQVTKPNVSYPNRPRQERKPMVEQMSQTDVSTERERQKRLAEQILEKEELARTEALQMEIFGEVVPEDAETKKKREEKERLENQRKREEAQVEKLRKQEEKRLAELEKKRLEKEAAEQARIAKELQAAKDKVRWDNERKKRDMVEARELENRRQKAEEKIIADREKKATEDAEREREKQKAREIEVKNADLAERKARQEEAKRRADSIHIAKSASVDKGIGPTEAPSSVANMSDDASSELPLFVSDQPPTPPRDPSLMGRLGYDANQPSVKKPATAAEVMALARPAPSSYRAAKDAEDSQIKGRSMAERLTPQEKAAAARGRALSDWPDNATGQKRVAQTTASASQPIRKNVFQKDVSASQPNKPSRQAFNGKSNGNVVGSSSQSAARNISGVSQSSALFPTSISRSELRKYSKGGQDFSLAEAKLREAQAPARKGKDPAKMEVYNAKARERATIRAREKEKARLLAAAATNGNELSEEELRELLDKFMARREIRLKSRSAKMVEKDTTSNAFPTFSKFNRNNANRDPNLPAKDYPQAPGFAPGSVQLLKGVGQQATSQDLDWDDNTSEGQQRRANESLARENLKAVAQDRNGSFGETAMRKTCQDFFDQDKLGDQFMNRADESSDASEEDPDDEPIPSASNTMSHESSQLGDDDDDDDMSDEDDSDEDDESSENAANHNASDQGGNNSPLVESLTQTIAGKKSPLALFNQDPPIIDWHEISPDIIFVYWVVRRNLEDMDDDDIKPKIVQQYTNRMEANSHAQIYLDKCRKKGFVKFSDGFDPVDDLYSGKVTRDAAGNFGVLIHVVKQQRTASDVPNFDPEKDNRLPNKFWSIKRVLVERQLDEETQMYLELPPKEEVLEYWSDLKQVNQKACQMLIDFVRPSKIDDYEWWANVFQVKLRDMRDDASRKGEMFGVELASDGVVLTEGEKPRPMPWMKKYSLFTFKVELEDMNGPRN